MSLKEQEIRCEHKVPPGIRCRTCDGPQNYTDKELTYAATGRCKCGAGLAYPLDYPLDTDEALKLGAWVCSKVLKGEALADQHDHLPFAFWKVREETSINNASGATTRPEGTVALIVGYATCPKCHWKWKSKPQKACGLNHHWFSGPCPECGYAVGGAGTHSSDEGPSIEHRYKKIVIETGTE